MGAGEWLFREGDEATSLYVVRSGRLEVVAEGPSETVVRVMRRGEVLGELALLHQERRSASVRARRDSELLEVGRDQFEALIADAPSFAIGLMRAIGAQLAASRTPVFAATPPRTVGVLALDPAARAQEIAGRLATALRDHGTVAELLPDPERSAASMVELLDRAEEVEDRVVMVGRSTEPGDLWTDFCVREAELVLAVTSGRPGHAWLTRPDPLRGCELLVTGPAVTEDVIATLRPRETQVVADPSDLDDRIEATARRLAGRSVGVVLSGGGARALAHLGVLDELNDAGVKIDRIGAVSLGGIVGAAVASGLDEDEISDGLRVGFAETNPTGDYTLPFFSLVRGRRARSLLDRYFGGRRIEELPKRFFCLSCDLISREPVIHRTGPLSEAVYASLAIPGVFAPVPTADGRLLVDGGVLDNLPVATMARSGEGPVIAVDVSGRMGQFKRPVRPGVERLAGPVRRFLTGSEAALPRLGETVLRTVAVGSIDTVAAARRHADLVIQPRVEGIGLLDWRRLDVAREAGREATRAALVDAPAAVFG